MNKETYQLFVNELSELLKKYEATIEFSSGDLTFTKISYAGVLEAHGTHIYLLEEDEYGSTSIICESEDD